MNRIKYARITGYGAYWDGYTFNCMDEAKKFNAAEIAAYKEGYVEARKEDKGK